MKDSRRMPFRLDRFAWGLLAIVSAAVPVAAGEPRPGDEDLPSAERVIEDHIQATGGRAAHEGIRNRVTQGIIDMSAMGMKATITAYAAPPNKSHTFVEIPGVGTQEQGTSGDVAWEVSMMGPRLKEGEEAAVALREETFDGLLRWKELYDKAEVTGTETDGQRTLYKVVLTPAVGRPIVSYFDKETRFQAKLTITVSSAFGELEMTYHFDDYREVGGIRLPHRIRQESMMGQFELIFQGIVQNVKLADDCFDPPSEIQALVEKRNAKEGAAKKGPSD